MSQTPRFSVNKDWTTLHIPSWKKLLARVFTPGQQVNVVEIGCFEGRSTCWFIDHLLDHPDSRIYCIDTWRGGEEVERASLPFNFETIRQNFHHNLHTTKHPHKAIVLEGRSDSVLLMIASYMNAGNEAPMFDIAYIDGSHTGKDVLFDTMMVYRMLKPGGMIIFDDYMNGMGTGNHALRPKDAIDSFVRQVQHEVKFGVTAMRQAFLIKKRV